MLAAQVSFDQTYDILLMIGAVLLAVGGFYRWAWLPFVKGEGDRAQRIAEHAIAPIVDKLDDIVNTVNTVRGEVQTNGGKSLKDVVLDTRTKQAELAARFDQHMQEADHG